MAKKKKQGQVFREGLLGENHIFEINLQFFVHLSRLSFSLISLPDFKTLFHFENLLLCMNI